MPNDRRPDPRPPHPATVVQRHGQGRPPHPATVAQPKRGVASSPARPPHPATVAPRAIQRSEKLEILPLEESTKKKKPSPLFTLLTGQVSMDLTEEIFSYLALSDLQKLALVCTASYDAVMRPGRRRIELGAGNMSSAAIFGLKETLTAFTEFDPKNKLRDKYGEGFTKNIAVRKDEKFIANRNVIMYGVDATQVGPFASLPRTQFLRFTNPNLGNEETSDRISNSLDKLLEVYLQGNEYVAVQVFGLWFTLDLRRLKTIKEGPKNKPRVVLTPKAKRAHLANTSYSIMCCCNVNLLLGFFANASSKLLGGGLVELIVKPEYIERWPILQLAEVCGFELVGKNTSYELGFANVHTQSSEEVGSQVDVLYLYLCFGRGKKSGTFQELYELMLDLYAKNDTSKTQANLVCDIAWEKPKDIAEFKL